MNTLRLYSEDELFDLVIRKFNVALHREGKTMVGTCPFCRDGTRRFVVWAEGNYYCRFCNVKGFIKDSYDSWRNDPAQLELMKQRTAELERQRLERIERGRKNFDPNKVLQFYNNLKQKERDFLHSQGIPDWAIDDYKIGYCPEKTVSHNGELYHVPAHTIPIYKPDDWKIINVQYRLTDPPGGKGKYRQELNLPQASFYAAQGETDSIAIVMEGAKKAIVLYDLIGKTMQTVGLPGISPSEELLTGLETFKTIYLIPDPGACEQALRIIKLLKHPRIGLVTISVKPDDAVVKYGMNQSTFKNLLHQADWFQGGKPL